MQSEKLKHKLLEVDMMLMELWKLEGALCCLWIDTSKQLAFFSQLNFGDMKSNEFTIHLIKHKELIMHSTLQITATALSQIYLQSMRQIQGNSRST